MDLDSQSTPLSPLGLATWAPSLPLEGRLQTHLETHESADHAPWGRRSCVCRGSLSKNNCDTCCWKQLPSPSFPCHLLSGIFPSPNACCTCKFYLCLLCGWQTRCPEACREEGYALCHTGPRSTEGWFPGHLPQLCPSGSQGLPPNPRTPEGLVPHERGRLRSDQIGDVGKP